MSNDYQPESAGARERAPDVRMTWENLLFVHWRLPAEVMRALVPRELEIDLFDGSGVECAVSLSGTEEAGSFRQSSTGRCIPRS